jgi:hypothetical protein
VQIESSCIECNRLRGGFRCEAFPAGIPPEILTGVHDHREPYEGDHGILFEPVKQAKEPAAA